MTPTSVMSVGHENIPEYFWTVATFTSRAGGSRSAFRQGGTPMKWMWSAAHVVDDHQAMMRHDGMMEGDATMAKKDEPGASNEMHDHMMPGTVVLTGRSDLKKHVGQKVTVTGSLSHGMSETMPNDRDTLAVASLKVVAKSCS